MPQPLRPITAVTWPACRSRSTPATAITSPGYRTDDVPRRQDCGLLAGWSRRSVLHRGQGGLEPGAQADGGPARVAHRQGQRRPPGIPAQLDHGRRDVAVDHEVRGKSRAHRARRRDVHDGVGVVQHPLDPVLGDDHGDGEVVHEPGDGGEHLLGAGGVERRGRLVEQDDAGVRREHRADGDPLLLAAGQLAQRHVAQLGDAEQVERLLDPPAHRRRGQAELLHAVGELLLDGVGDEAGERVLPHDADEVGQVTRAVVAGVAPVQAHVAGQRAAGEVGDPAAHGAEQGRLARPGAPDDERQLALADVQVDLAQHRPAGARRGHRHPASVRSRSHPRAPTSSRAPRWGTRGAGRGGSGVR